MRGRIASRVAIHPVFVAALVALILNDHAFKAAYPGWVTGKASDVAGLIVFPLMIVSAVDLTIGLRRSWARYVVGGVIGATGVAFAAIQVNTSAADVYRTATGLLQYPFRATLGAAGPVAVRHTADPTDLLALAVLVVPWLIYRGAIGRPQVQGAAPSPVSRPVTPSLPPSPTGCSSSGSRSRWDSSRTSCSDASTGYLRS